MVRPTGFRPLRPADPDVRVQFHKLYEELIADEARDQLICQDVIHALREGRSPLVLTERNEHLDSLTKQLTAEVQNLIVLRGGMRKRNLTLFKLAWLRFLVRRLGCSWPPAGMWGRALMMPDSTAYS